MLYLLIAVIGATALALGLSSRLLREAPLTEPLAALLVGAIIGPEAIDLVGRDEIAIDVVGTAALLVLAASVMSAALRHPVRDIRAVLRPIVILLVVGLPVMAVASATAAVLVVGIPVASAAVIGAILAPTDPVLTSNAITGHAAETRIPDRIRTIVSTESASNHGLADGILVICIAAAVGSDVAGRAAGVALSVMGSVMLGGLLGWIVGRLVVASELHHDIEHTAFLVLTLSLVATTLGISETLGGESILAVFFAALAYAHMVPTEERREEWEVQEAVNRYLVLPVFTLLGISLPWAQWAELGWAAPALVVAIQVARRIPMVFALRRPLGLGPAEAGFVAWTGPVGIGAIYLGSRAVGHDDLDDRIWPIVTLAVATAVVTHGTSAAWVRRASARRLTQHGAHAT